ncbi:hypothetical protein CIPAW_15G139500 [Carya illinoinensis]|uniref:No apical meristem-associated C-terminal domain-containing protein n=1 Tax=Carya illinoinensis TaxID=32201 RepID=A0A8T1N791_CARIL|nr:hypothetical protein CIPAW_15G139500 [Carya illinoinensis]
MDSQDPGHMYFTNLLSEDPQLDPTYGGQSGTPPMTLNDSPPLPPNESIKVRKSVRGANFTPQKDKLLVSAWLNCSLDVVQGTDQKHSQLWEKIFEYFQQYKETINERTIKQQICAKLVQVEGLNQSGMTEQDKDQPKWIWRATKDDPKRRKTMSLSPTPTPTRCSAATEDSVFDLEMENVIENEVIELDRPMGRKAEKEKRKAQGERVNKLRLEDDRLRLEAEKLRIKAKKEQSKIHQEDERLRLEAEKVELAKKESDQRIMIMDVSVMLEMQRLYFQQLQREIMIRRSNARDLD